MLPQMLPWETAQTQWAQQLNPLISGLLSQGLLLQNQPLVTGVNAVNHKLGRKLVGWFVVGINGAAQIYDNQATNQTPQLTLSLTSDADVLVNLWVF